MMDLSVVLPVYNERESLSDLLSELARVLEPYRFEVIAVDDGSTDDSWSVLSQWQSEKPWLRLIQLRKNAGQTAAFDVGFRNASGRVIVTLDSDGQNDPADIPKLLAKIDEGFDFVAGWRKSRQDGFWLRRLPSTIANGLIRSVTKTSLRDLGCSLKAYRAEVVRELRIYGEMHRFLGVLVEDLGARVSQLEVHHRPRVRGKSKYGLSRTFSVLVDLITVWFFQRYRSKPSRVFGTVGLAGMGVSLLLSAYVLWEKLAWDIWVHRNPLFIIAAVFGIVGVQFVGLGIMAELSMRTYYEASEQVPYLIRERRGFDVRDIRVP